MTKSQVDKLGERLRAGNHSDDDLRLLDEYRQSFTDAYDLVVQRIAESTGIELTGRRIKSTQSIVSKLKRQSTKLSQIQDIAGCRIIVDASPDQNKTVGLLKLIFEKIRLSDRRQKPSHEYRAVHLIATISGKPVEIQIRTRLQHLWAQLSEQLSDAIDPTIKYGGGSESERTRLSVTSAFIAHIESIEEWVHEGEHGGIEIADKRRELVQLQDRAKEMLFRKLAGKTRKEML